MKKVFSLGAACILTLIMASPLRALATEQLNVISGLNTLLQMMNKITGDDHGGCV